MDKRRSSKTLVLLLIGLLSGQDLLQAQFGGGHEVQVEGPHDMQLVDLDQDGTMELLVGTRNGILLYPFNGYQLTAPITLMADQVVMLAADVDGDGLVDIVASSEHDLGVSWYHALGGYGFGPAQNISNGVDAVSIRAGDLDGDGDLDLVMTMSNGQLRWYENLDGAGAFGQAVPVSTNATPSDADAVDMDQDGDLDLVWSESSTNSILWAENLTSNAVFGPPQTATQVGCGMVRDIDGDGLADLVTSSPMDLQVHWQRGLGNGFAPAQSIGSPWGVVDEVLAQDLDLDGDLDVAVISSQLNEIAWYENIDGQGQFGPRQVIATGMTNAFGLMAGDLDGDGDAELFMLAFAPDHIIYFDNLSIASNSIVGRVFNDIDGDGVFNNNDHGLYNFRVEASDLGSTFTNHSGMYSYHAVPGPYAVWLPSVAGWSNTTPALRNVTVTTQNNTALEQDFGLHADQDIVDLVPQLVPGNIRCSEVVPFWLNITNAGTVTTDLTMTLHLDPLCSFSGSQPAADAVNGNVVSWDLASVPATHHRSVLVLVQMPDGSHMGETMIDSLVVTADVNGTPYRVSCSAEPVVACSADPNDKQVAPVGSGPDHEVALGTPLTFTIRFQNVGNAPAYQVTIADTLDQGLDLTSFRMLAASHAVSTELDADGVLHFRFDNIQLPDSATDPRGSQGFVRYGLSPMAGMAVGTAVRNSASIVFDQNGTVVTNTTLTTYGQGPVGIDGPKDDATSGITVVPNPVIGSATIRLGDPMHGRVTFALFDAEGRSVRAFDRRSNVVVLDRGDLDDGVYLLVATDEFGQRATARVLFTR
ncbi:MAG: VCBS repeat-containing protein [Flavobacteriales bacterium]|nr:VCBS repeat-containing protein [Flavobacteriales bacterium]MCB9193839.1 VCBS repeat-containing protein [Flavobacteriales bacterium]